MKSIKDFNVAAHRILVRCDFNVPIDEQGNILDDFRIQKTLPTLQYLLAQKAKIIIITHLGEPEGVVVENLKLDNVRKRLEELLGLKVIKADDCVGAAVQKQVTDLVPGQILLLENVRFHKEETHSTSSGQADDDDLRFAKELAALGDIYINDAFGDCHRAHASMVLVPMFLPHGMGLLLQNEIEHLNKVLENPAHPMVALVGGIKVGTKAAFIEKISKLADTVLISGPIKKEGVEKNLHFTENVIGPKDNLAALDIDEETIKSFQERILPAKTIVWNGPFGKFEDAQYRKGTQQIAKAIIESGAFCVAGGGETIEFLRQEGMIDKFSHVSTGGGAMLEFLAGQVLPGLEALK